MTNRRKIYSLLGLPASGKGTQARFLAELQGIKQIVGMGDLIREVIASDSKDPFVVEVKKRYEAGIPQPDSVACDLLQSYLTKLDPTESLILDNFPFTRNQAEFMLELLRKMDLAESYLLIYIKVNPEVAIKRSTMRKVCTDCGTIYGGIDSMICDKCGGALVVRSDDNVETMKTRISHYYPKINEVIDYFKQSKLPYLEINGEGSVAEVSAEIKAKL